jgi:hypothetical protein
MEEELVLVSKKRLDELESQELVLNALRCAGVDNWEGCDYAYELLEEWNSKTEI